MVKKTFKITGMHCTSCAMVIESDLEDIGVRAACSYAKGVLNVEYDERAVNEKKVHEVVAASGYSLSD